MSAVILATVGTDVHPFDRMVRWVDDWAAEHPEAEVVIQYGTACPPKHADGVDYLSHEALQAWVEKAAVVITHGGPATIMEVRGTHGRPIVIPRNPVLGEHVDRHQMVFCDMLNARKDIRLARSSEHLVSLIEEDIADPPLPCGLGGDIPEGVRRFAELVGELLDNRRTK